MGEILPSSAGSSLAGFSCQGSVVVSDVAGLVFRAVIRLPIQRMSVSFRPLNMQLVCFNQLFFILGWVEGFRTGGSEQQRIWLVNHTARNLNRSWRLHFCGCPLLIPAMPFEPIRDLRGVPWVDAFTNLGRPSVFDAANRSFVV